MTNERKGVAIVTGADGGMGMEETRALALAGYHTVMACYCPSLAREKRRQLVGETGNSDIEIMGLDLANLESVRHFADTFAAKCGPAHLLMNNAGTMETGLHITPDGLERTASVNYVGPALLTRLLAPQMPRGSRVVNMASCVYRLGRLHFPDFFLRGRRGSFWRIPVYSNTKLAITLFTLSMAERMRESGVTVNAADPGIVDTGIIRMQMFFDPLTDILFRPLIRTPRQGADTAIRLLLDADKQGQTATFNASARIVPLGPKYTAHPLMQELWERTTRIIQPFLSHQSQ